MNQQSKPAEKVHVVEKSALDEARRDKAETLKRLRARVIGYSASRNVFRVIDDEIQKADPSYKPNYSARARSKVVIERNELVEKLRVDLATANAEIERLREHIGRTSGLYTCPTCGEDVSNEPGHFKSYGAMQADLDTANALLEKALKLASHKFDCKYLGPGHECSCGFNGLRKEIEQHRGGKL